MGANKHSSPIFDPRSLRGANGGGRRGPIGSLNEKPLHASLKACYAQPGDQLEARVDGYVIDILRRDIDRRDLLLEIQTSSFASIKTKIVKLAQTHPIRVIY